MKHLLSSSAFLIVNKQLAKQVGLKGAVLLADLISKEEYFIANGMTDGWFFNTAKNIEEDTCLTSHQQRKAIKSLKELGIIETKVIGVPAKQHFKIIENKLLSYFNTSCEESVKLVVKKTQTINKNNNKNNNNNNISNRRNEFVFEVLSFDYDESVLNGFIDYWTEPNKSNTKMKYELNKTWETKRRLKTWAANQKKWDKPKSNKKTMSKLDAQINEWQKAKELLVILISLFLLIVLNFVSDKSLSFLTTSCSVSSQLKIFNKLASFILKYCLAGIPLRLVSIIWYFLSVLRTFLC